MAISNLDAEEEKVPIITEVLARITELRAWGKVASLDAADDCGRTALSYLAEAENVDAVKVYPPLGRGWNFATRKTSWPSTTQGAKGTT